MPDSVKKRKKVLIAPLDWGLGHATRCIPVVRYLMRLDCEVWIAGSGPSLQLLRTELPELPFLILEGYGVRYGKSGVLSALFRQMPAIRKHIQRENIWLKEIQAVHHFDGIISDNRYGLYHPKVPSVLITHQLDLQIPAYLFFVKPFVRNILYHYLQLFNACWIPDLPVESESLAGALSHPDILPKVKVSYLGLLSRMVAYPNSGARTDMIFISLSGPEPQRSLFEEIIWKQLFDISNPIVLVRGLPGEKDTPKASPHVKVFNHLPTAEIIKLMAECHLMICRSGYSSLMDAAVLATPLACVPTPGQTEQEYLAKRLAKNGLVICENQAQFRLEEIVQKSPIPFNPTKAMAPDIMENVIFNWVNSLD